LLGWLIDCQRTRSFTVYRESWALRHHKNSVV
jgi:hypothetical protein